MKPCYISNQKTGETYRGFATFLLILIQVKYMLSKFLNSYSGKSLFLLPFLILTFISCEDIPNEMIDESIQPYSVVDVEAPASFVYSSSDSMVTIHAAVDNSEPIERIYANVVSLETNFTLTSDIDLLDNGDELLNGDLAAEDNIFSGKFSVPKNIANGDYEIQFLVKAKNSAEHFAAAKKIKLFNGQENVPPVISNLQAPDTLTAPELEIQLSIDVEDPNGLVGTKVYFLVTRPDGTSHGNKVFMFDDGDEELHGDENAGDGRYSLKISLPSDTNKGTWRFDFQAEDNDGALSNIISHNIVIK